MAKTNKLTELNLLKERVLTLLLQNPDNKQVKKLFIESYGLNLTLEDDSEDLFSFTDEKEAGLEKNLQKVEIVTPKQVVDPLFGMKLALCLGDANSIQLALIREFEKSGPENALKILNLNYLYDPYEKDKDGTYRVKYSGALRDTEKLNISQDNYKPLTYNSPEYTEKNPPKLSKKEMAKVMAKSVNSVWMGLPKGEQYKYISRDRDQSKFTISAVGAGQIEFLIRMYMFAKTGTYAGIPSSIQIQGGLNSKQAEAQEQFLLEISKNIGKKIEERAFSILDSYLRTAVFSTLETFIKRKDLSEFIDAGMDKVFDNINSYNLDSANFASWAFQVIKNQSKNLLSKTADYKYDDVNAQEWAYNQPKANDGYIYIRSNLNPHVATGEFKNSIDKESSGKPYHLYMYESAEDLLIDLRVANGFYEDIDKYQGVAKTKAGRPKKTDPNNPLYYKNLPLQVRKNFMTSSDKAEYMDVPGVTATMDQTADTPKRNKDSDYVDANNKIQTIAGELFNKLINAPTGGDPYSLNQIRRIIKDNADLSIRTIAALLNYGIYEFGEKQVAGKSGANDRKTYSSTNWVTNPETIRSQFLSDLKSSIPKGVEFPEVISSTDGSQSISDNEFVKKLRNSLLGSGTGKGKGFLIQNPEILNNIVAILKQIPRDMVAGRTNTDTFDDKTKERLNEEFSKVTNMLNEIQLQFNKLNTLTINNFIKQWKN